MSIKAYQKAVEDLVESQNFYFNTGPFKVEISDYDEESNLPEDQVFNVIFTRGDLNELSIRVRAYCEELPAYSEFSIDSIGEGPWEDFNQYDSSIKEFYIALLCQY